MHELGLGCMEMEFVRGVQMGEQKAAAVAEVAKELQIGLSAHAPYFINLNAREPEKIRASQERIVHSARIASLCGARSVVVHTAYFMKDTPEEAYPKIKKNLKETLDMITELGIEILIRPEVMGKASQFGNVDEVIRLCSELEGTAPCIDFAHCHAATGAFNTYEEFASILEKMESGLGKVSLDDMHLHCSGIKYGARGEQKHLNMADSDFNFRDLMKALKDYRVKGLLICESPNLEEDALLLQETYHNLY
ncbi:MAG: TIM barrel protein [Dehalococcoidales bacterium]|nr:TIM barrel protein [Dehalococcoidales bacterium]